MKSGCQAGDKCQYAHGVHELRTKDDPVPTENPQDLYVQQMYAMIGMTNYKTMKCFYFQKDNYCKNGRACQFAHSDAELRTPSDMEYLSSIANSINCQVSGGNPTEYNQYNNYDPYSGYQYYNYDQYNTGMQGNENLQNAYYPSYEGYDYSPDTNYGDQTQSNYGYNEYVYADQQNIIKEDVQETVQENQTDEKKKKLKIELNNNK